MIQLSCSGMKSSEKYLFGNLGWWYRRLSVVVPLIPSSGTPRAQKPGLYSVVVLSEPAVVPPRLAKVKSMHRVDAFGNSLGVCRKLAEGIGSLPGWCKGVRQKMTETRRKIVGGRDSPKESGSSLGTRREIARKKTGGLAARLPECAGITGGDQWLTRVNRLYLNFLDTVKFWLRF
ncbi:hypothetical protein BHE74_00058232 [Ensete ventricosum]|nr:hypothetical protein BHE74_00058232 [Ensete ventricosum]